MVATLTSQETGSARKPAAERIWHELRGLFLDLDGVVFCGKQNLPGIAELDALIRDRRLALMVVSNNSADSPSSLAARLRRAGLSVTAHQIVTAALVTQLHLERHYPAGTRIMVLGRGELRRLLVMGERFVRDEVKPDVVVVGRLGHWPSERVKQACRAILAGADFIGTNADTYIPGDGGIIPETGAMLAYIEAVTGRKPTILGKPKRTIFKIAIERTELAPAQLLMIGDRIDIDVAGADRLGMRSALVLTDATRAFRGAPPVAAPDLVVNSLAELARAWRRAMS